ncbi:DUF5682 family protein [Herbaspirillum huttiense F1]|uniref:DUF5682 family protein n=1 Tax=Herbaspirillum TaxID=963 RepID=UPI001066F91F|nr:MULTISPECIES: DUF5682 family protein [Herbaspirillum]MBP1313253.1 hypothetical protein [Herbaspirillum sp. 1130]MDT0356032.1 DUF5682 family protein [Herbaspirillum huttiense F1]
MLPISDHVRALGAQLFSDELVVFPVRHHSPVCAWHLQQLLEQIRPSVVLVEGPRSFTALLPQLVDSRARMPLAIYTYAVRRAKGDEPPPRRAAYYPFCDHSPELVAARAASRQGIPVRFMDLDFSEQILLTPAIQPEGTHAESLLEERHYRRSHYLSALAERLGCRDHEELWEHLFEIPGTTRTVQEHVTTMVAYCHLARGEYGDQELQAEGNLAREAEMAWHIREALATRQPGAGPVLAVMGGFHAVVMPDLLRRGEEGAPRPSLSLLRQDIADEASALIRYSFDRLDRLNGYCAGMTSPAWQHQVWEGMRKASQLASRPLVKVRHDVALHVLFDVAARLRQQHGMRLPTPTLAAAYEHVVRLTRLRGRPAPAREDVMDAVTSCFVKGDTDAEGAQVFAAAGHVLSGDAMGQVPPNAGMPPLVQDFHYRARRQRLKIDDVTSRRLLLDIYRRPEHRTTSRLLHGLAFLGIPLAARTGGPDFVNGIGLERLHEQWQYAYSAATEATLVEASVYGVTVPMAVANRFLAKVAQLEADSGQHSARAGAALLTQACVLGLHDHVPRVVALLRRQVGADPAFDSVVAAAGSLCLLTESREPLEAREVEGLPDLLQAAYARAIYLGRELDGHHSTAGDSMQALARLRELLASRAGDALDASLYWAMVVGLHAGHDSTLICGAAAGLLFAAGRLTDAGLGTVLRGHLRGMAPPHAAVGFLRGLFHTAREVAWQQEGVLQVLDHLLAEWDDEAFIANLPELRLAFTEMTPKETGRIAESVARLHGQDYLGRLTHHDLSAADVQAHLVLSQSMEEILRNDGLQGWMT